MALRASVVRSSLGLLALLASCSSYAVPGRGADMSALAALPANESEIGEILARAPSASFPTALAVVRVQEPDYSSYTMARAEGGGRYSVVTARDVETEADLARIAALPEVSGVAVCSALLVPDRIDGPLDLRAMAAQLHADMLLVYTLDTVFTSEDKAEVLTLISLGILPTQHVRVTTTAAAVLLDTKSGYVYGVAEATAKGTSDGSAWSTEEVVDAARRDTERRAFTDLLGEFERTWSQVLAQHASAAPVAASDAPGP